MSRIIRNLYFQSIIPIFCSLLMVPGIAGAAPPVANQIDESIKIGLLITVDTSESALTKQAVDVVDLVVDDINSSGGIQEKYIEVVIKSVDGNWGAGSKRAVDLIFEDHVSALLGFVDGRSAHLIEQVSVKAQIPFVSTFSPDPSLSKINIPWFFSTMPHSDQQAKVMADEITKNYSNNKILVVSSEDYDQSFNRRSFLQEIEKQNVSSPKVLDYQAGEDNFEQIASKISESDAGVIAFFGNSEELAKLISKLEIIDVKNPLYTPIIDLSNDRLQNASNQIFTIKSKNWDSEREKKFREDFYQEYGYRPGIYATYLYDGITALFEAIRLKGAENYQIREALGNINIPGMNGTISFDDTGMVESDLLIVNASQFSLTGFSE